MSDDGLYFGQCLRVQLDEAEWGDKQIEAFAAEWRRKIGGPPKLLTPLPRRVRLRLAATRAIDRAAIWLVDRGRFGAAERLWRAFGMWSR